MNISTDNGYQTTVHALSLSILTVAQVAKELHLSRAKVYQLVKFEGLPTVKFGTALRVRRVSLDKWLESREASAIKGERL